MGEVFKLKVCVGDANIELEGDGNLVHTIFSELRENGMGKLSARISGQSKDKSSKKDVAGVISTLDENDEKSIVSQNTESYDLPSIDTIIIKNLPKTEVEWMLIYALYISEQGNKVFTENDVRKMYHSSGRWSKSRSKNFSANLKKAVKVDWFLPVNDSNYSLLDTGKSKAYEILHRTAKSGITKKATNLSKATYKIMELGLSENQRQDIKKYLLSFPSVNNMDRAVLIAYKLAEYGITDFNENTIFTILRIADLSTSYDLKSSLTNGKSKKNFFTLGDTAGMYKLHNLGEDRAKELEKARGHE